MRLNARAPIIIRGDEIAHLDADGYKHLPRAASLPDGKILASSGGAWRPSDLSGVSVSSAFGRTGAVAAQTGDYTAEQVGAEPYAGVPAQTSFWRSTAAGVRAWVQLVAADITDLATTLAAYLTKANPTFTGTLSGQSARFYDLSGNGDGVTICDSLGNVSRQTIEDFRDATLQVIPWSAAGIPNGVAELDSTGRVPSRQLPSYLALGETSSTAYRGDRGATAWTHSQVISGNPHGTTPDDIGAFAKVFVLGGINFHDFDTPGVYEIRGNSWANGWAGLTGTQGVALLQMHDADGLRVLVAGDTQFGGLQLKFQATAIPGDHWSPWFQVWDSGSLPAGTVGRSVLAATTAAAGRTAIDAAKKPSKIDVSASANLGSIDASAIKVTATDVTLTCSGGFDSQGWDIIGLYAIGISVPSGVTLYRYSGITVGPATYAPGGGRALRVVRVDASTWIMPNLS